MKKLVSAMLVAVAIIHLFPLVGVLGPGQLSALYGINFDEPNLAILMRHRAVLFGLLGVFLVYAACKPHLQSMALVAGLVSVISFLLLAWSIGGYNSFVSKIISADKAALVCLLVGVGAYIFSKRAG